MEQLLKIKVSSYFQSSKTRTIPNVTGDVWASYPLSTLTLFKDYMTVEVFPSNKFVLPYDQIESLEIKNFFWGIFGNQIQIHHKIETIKPFVYISGFGNGSILIRKVCKTILDNNLSIIINK